MNLKVPPRTAALTDSLVEQSAKLDCSRLKRARSKQPGVAEQLQELRRAHSRLLHERDALFQENQALHERLGAYTASADMVSVLAMQTVLKTFQMSNLEILKHATAICKQAKTHPLLRSTFTLRVGSPETFLAASSSQTASRIISPLHMTA